MSGRTIQTARSTESALKVRSAFLTQPHLVMFPERVVDREERWQAIGSAGDVVVLAVAHAVSDESGVEVVRIISARKATPAEREVRKTVDAAHQYSVERRGPG